LYCEIDLEDSNVIQDSHKALSEVFQEEFGDGSPQNTSVHVSVLNLISAIRRGDRPPRCMADNDRPPLSTYFTQMPGCFLKVVSLLKFIKTNNNISPCWTLNLG